MIKRFFILGLAMLLSVVGAFAQTIEVDGIYYNLSGTEAEVTSPSWGYYAGDIVIPGTINYLGTDYSVTGIGDDAFHSCNALTSINFPDNVTTIGDHAFDQCTQLTPIDIPNSVTTIGIYAFSNCKSITSITIPDQMTTLAKGIFYWCIMLESVTILGNIESIGEEAFLHCNSLDSVIIPNSVTTIGDLAFCDCTALTNVYAECTVPPSVSENTFEHVDTGQVRLHIPCDSYDSYAEADVWKYFKIVGCYWEVTVGVNNENYGIATGDGTYKDAASATVTATAYDGYKFVNWTKDGGVVSSDAAYTFTVTEDVALVANLAPIAYTVTVSANPTTSGTATITSPDDSGNYDYGTEIIVTATAYDGYKFVNWTTDEGEVFTDNPHTFTVTEDVALVANFKPSISWEIGYPNPPDIIAVLNLNDSTLAITGKGAMQDFDYVPWSDYRDAITTAVIGDSVTTIGERAFSDCTALDSITLPNSVITIGNYAFSGCTALESITLPDGVTTIENYVFSGCTALESIILPDSVITIGNYAFSGCTALESIILPDSVITIGDWAFSFCTALASITIPDGVTTIGNYAFSGCHALTSVIIGNSVTAIGGWTFNECYALTSVIIGNSVTTIGTMAFDGCIALDSITLPNSVITIGFMAFCGCIALDSITLPNSVTTIGDWAFEACSALKSITIPNSVTTIGFMAFGYCSALKSITLPNSVTKIGLTAFEACTALTDVYVSWEIPLNITNSYIFKDVNIKNVNLHIPCGSYDSYAKANVWKDFNIVECSSLHLNSTGISSEGCIKLGWQWLPTPPSGTYGYTLYQWDSIAGWQSTSTNYDKEIRVLNVYPDIEDSNTLKEWMDNDEIGFGKIQVTPVKITDFNNNPDSYLKNESGQYQYDVIMFGSWDSNNSKDLTPVSAVAVEDFLKSGRGVLFGHDTQRRAHDPNFISLADYINLHIDNAADKYFRGSTQIKVVNDGFLLKYPHHIPFGDILEVPCTHTSGQFAKGIIWMDFPDPQQGSCFHADIQEINGGTNNFYLTTWNNAAMIQTGHSSGESTEDERKVLANTLWYLAQFTTDTTAQVCSALDLAAPDTPTVKRQTDHHNLLDIVSKDNGTLYRFYVKATNVADDADTCTSKILDVVNTSGLKGFYILEDSIATSDPDISSNFTTFIEAMDDPLVTYTIQNVIQYVHIQAVDFAGNLSEIVTLEPLDIQILDFDTYCATKWNNTFLLDLKALETQYSEVTACKWYKNGSEIGEGFFYSAGDKITDRLEADSIYTFELNTSNHGALFSTNKIIPKQYTTLRVYPNPLPQGNRLTIEGIVEGALVEVYDLNGLCVSRTTATGNMIELTLTVPAGAYVVRANKEEIKVIIK